MPINNGYLKEIAGINRDLKTHLARHTFADMMLNNGVLLEDVSNMPGHKISGLLNAMPGSESSG